jgi:hypothetical protein
MVNRKSGFPEYPEDGPEFLKALQERRKYAQDLSDTLVQHLKFERALREHNAEEFRKAKRRALLTLARTEPLMSDINRRVRDDAKMRMLGYGKRDK